MCRKNVLGIFSDSFIFSNCVGSQLASFKFKTGPSSWPAVKFFFEMREQTIKNFLLYFSEPALLFIPNCGNAIDSADLAGGNKHQ